MCVCVIYVYVYVLYIYVCVYAMWCLCCAVCVFLEVSTVMLHLPQAHCNPGWYDHNHDGCGIWLVLLICLSASVVALP